MAPTRSLAEAGDTQLATPRPHLQRLLARARALGPISVAVAYPCDAGSLQAALQAARSPKPRPWLWPTAMATACSLALAVAIWPRVVPQPVPAPTTAAQPEDFTMLAGDEQLDLYQEFDFYVWLDAQPQSG